MAFAAPTLAADARPCQANYKQGGNFINGRTFSTWEIVPGVKPSEAFSRIQADGLKSGLRVASSDKGSGTLSFEQNAAHKGQTIQLPWNIVIEGAGKDVKITVSKSTPPGYASGKETQINSMCAVIDSARKK
ncbi:MAG: hypothetical protein JNM58_09310 [Xanthomonadaceae bacterium]|nr:hypothetical protein [Xanthomonadaceae bacterium]